MHTFEQSHQRPAEDLRMEVLRQQHDKLRTLDGQIFATTMFKTGEALNRQLATRLAEKNTKILTNDMLNRLGGIGPSSQERIYQKIIPALREIPSEGKPTRYLRWETKYRESSKEPKTWAGMLNAKNIQEDRDFLRQLLSTPLKDHERAGVQQLDALISEYEKADELTVWGYRRAMETRNNSAVKDMGGDMVRVMGAMGIAAYSLVAAIMSISNRQLPLPAAGGFAIAALILHPDWRAKFLPPKDKVVWMDSANVWGKEFQDLARDYKLQPHGKELAALLEDVWSRHKSKNPLQPRAKDVVDGIRKTADPQKRETLGRNYALLIAGEKGNPAFKEKLTAMIRDGHPFLGLYELASKVSHKEAKQNVLASMHSGTWAQIDPLGSRLTQAPLMIPHGLNQPMQGRS